MKVELPQHVFSAENPFHMWGISMVLNLCESSCVDFYKVNVLYRNSEIYYVMKIEECSCNFFWPFLELVFLKSTFALSPDALLLPLTRTEHQGFLLLLFPLPVRRLSESSAADGTSVGFFPSMRPHVLLQGPWTAV